MRASSLTTVRTSYRHRVSALLFVLAVAGTPSLAALPDPLGRVSDFAGVLDDATERQLTAQLRALEDRTSAELAVVTVQSLDGMSVEEYANRLFKAWGIGQRGADNGVLLLVAPAEHEVRIEVGYGLEPILPDGLAGQVIRDECLPRFRGNDYRAGIAGAVGRLITIVQEKHVLTAAERAAIEAAADDRPPMLLMLPFFGVFIGIGAIAVGMGLKRKEFFGLLFGSIFGGIPFLMSLVPFFNAPWYFTLPFGLIMLAVGYRIGATVLAGTPTLRGHAGTRSGWTMGTSSGLAITSSSDSSNSDSSSSSSSSSDSFGGGSSGGGGASGSW